MDPKNVVNPIPINPKNAVISLNDIEKGVVVNSQQQQNPLNVLPIFASPQSLLAGSLIPFSFNQPSSVTHGLVPPVSASPPPRRLKKTTVFWDFENITMQRYNNQAVEELVSALRTYLQNNNCQLTKIHAIGDVNRQLPEETQEFMKRNAISLHHVPQERTTQSGHVIRKQNQTDFVIINELLNFVLDHPPPNNHNLSIVLLSSDSDFSMFASTLLNKGYEVHVIYRPSKTSNVHMNLPNSIKYVTWDKIQDLIDNSRPPREERRTEHTRSHSRERDVVPRTPHNTEKKREYGTPQREEDNKRGKSGSQELEKKKETDSKNENKQEKKPEESKNNKKPEMNKSPTRPEQQSSEPTKPVEKETSKKDESVPKNIDLKFVLPDSTIEKARLAKGYQGVIDCLCQAHKEGTLLTTEDFLRDLKNFRVFWMPSSLESAEEEGIISIQNNEVRLVVDPEKVKQCKSVVDKAKKFVGKLYSLSVNPCIDLLKIEIEITDSKLPWTQCLSLLRSDFEITQNNTISLKSGAPTKETLMNLDLALIQDEHWESLKSVLQKQNEFTSILELLTYLEAHSKNQEPAHVWFSLILESFQRSWLQVSNKAIRAVLWTVNINCGDNFQFNDLPATTTVGQLKDLLTEALGKELPGRMYYGEDRISYSATLETFTNEPYSCTGTEIELNYKEKSDSSSSNKKRKPQEQEEKATKKQSKSKN